MRKTLVALSGIMLLGTAVALAARMSGADDEERDDPQVVSLESLPGPARDALKKLVGSAKLGDISMEDEDGVKVFEAGWRADGVDQEVSVTEFGDVVETESVMDWENTPKLVRQTATKSFPKGAKLKVEKKTIVFYTIEAEVNEHEKEILVTTTGQRVEIEHKGNNQEEDEDEQ